MSDNCITCTRPVTSWQQAIQCDVCLQWNHRTCSTGKLPFILHFHSVCKTPFDLWGDVRYFATRNRSVTTYLFFYRNFSTRLSSCCTYSYRHRLGLHSLSVFYASGREFQNIYDWVVSRNSWVVRVQPSFNPQRFVPVNDLWPPN